MLIWTKTYLFGQLQHLNLSKICKTLKRKQSKYETKHVILLIRDWQV